MAASSSYFTSNRGQQQQQQRSRRSLQQSTAPSMGSRAPRNLVAARVASNPRGAYSQQTSILPNHVSRHRRHNLPRTVTPTNNVAGPSWEDFDEDPYGGNSSFPRMTRSRAQSSDRSVVSTSYVEMEEDLPIDEMIEDNLSVQSMPPIRRAHALHRRARSGSNNDFADTNSYSRSSSSIEHNSTHNHNSHRRNHQSMDWGSTELGQIGLHRRTHSNLSSDWADDVSSLGGVEDRTNGIGDIIRALKHRSKSRPSHLTAEERVLWESIQTSLNAARNEQMGNKRALERLLQDAARREAQIERKLTATQRQLVAVDGNNSSKSKNKKSGHMEVQVRDLETTLKSKQADHEREVRAMQRVLAAMSEERDQKTGELKKEIERLTEKYEGKEAWTDSTASETSSFLESQLAEAKFENQKLAEEISPLRAELEGARDEIASMKYRGGIPRSQSMTPPRYGVTSSNSFDAESASSAESVETLQRSLAETATSLENAKKIIASLENANGSLALDLRAKLKVKEQELHSAQTESADYKRRLDILATELRALQVKQGDSDRSQQRGSREQSQYYQDLVDLLEKSMSGLQSASVVHEASAATGQPDLSNLDQIGEILNETLAALRSTLNKALSSKEETKKSSEILIDGEKVSMKQMKDLLKKQHEQMKKLRKQVDEKNEGLENVKMMRAEIKNLKDKCTSNEKLLTKQDRELAVLRSSLPNDNDGGGYISDDDSGDEDEAASSTILLPPTMNYATQQNLSNILAQLGPPGSSSSDEVETLRKELVKALGEKELESKKLKEEKESLTNAKMIISSLENANKSMTADLRSRLHESNSEIAALNDKSKENEQAARELREEVERLKKEKAEHEAEIQRLKGVGQPENESADPKPEVEEKQEETVVAEV